jgi:polyribonucleotide nucleotidyltransferase
MMDEIIHEKALKENKRVDGRKLDELRNIEVFAGVLPRTHGTGLFLRGMTHALSVVTLGAPGDILMMQGMEVSGEKRFIHHYNFPAFSTGETGPNRGPGRREIGHGALAEKAIEPMIPPQDVFPYTIRIVTEILSSNGSTSMASVCGTSLALMDAGVPIKQHVAGIAMGLMMDKQGNYKILTDIQGPEDHHGDMDCKVAGTKDGINAVQMDVKIEGITPKMLSEVMVQAKKARLEILEKMNALIKEPRKELSPHAPRIMSIKIPKEKIGGVIGTGGKIIHGIMDESGAAIDIEEDGTIFVTGQSKESLDKAIEMIKAITKEYEVGEMLEGKVVKILDFGAVVDLGGGQEGLVHISELAPRRIATVEEIVKLGQVIPVKIIEVLNDGKIRLSLKQATNPVRNDNRSESTQQQN